MCYLRRQHRVKPASERAECYPVATGTAAGDERFPEESEKFKAQIQELHESGLMDPAEIERLRSIGYL